MKRAAVISVLLSLAGLLACVAGCEGCAPIPSDIGDAWMQQP